MVRFLMICFGPRAEILLATPLIRHLKKQVDHAEIHFLTAPEHAFLLEENPYLHQLHTMDGSMQALIRDLTHKNFDYLLDLQNDDQSFRIAYPIKRLNLIPPLPSWKRWLLVRLKINRLPDKHQVERHLHNLGAFLESVDGEGLDYNRPLESRPANSILPESHHRGYVAVDLGAFRESRRIPEELALKLCSGMDEPIVFLGNEAEQSRAGRLMQALPGRAIFNACGRFTAHEEAALVEASSLLVAPDGDLGQLAAALGTKVITLWGSTLPEMGTAPYKAAAGSASFGVSPLSCRPCSYIGLDRCPRGHFRCMMDQDVTAILEKISGIPA